MSCCPSPTSMNENHRNIGVRKRVRSLTGQFYFLEENKLARCTYAERRNPGRILSRMHDRLLASLIDYAADCSRQSAAARATGPFFWVETYSILTSPPNGVSQSPRIVTVLLPDPGRCCLKIDVLG